MLIKDLARAAGVTPQVARYYARAGLISAMTREDNGYRYFSLADAERIRFIKGAQAFGFTLAEIRELFSVSRVGTAHCCSRTKNHVAERLGEMRATLEEMEAQVSRVERMLDGWQSAGCSVRDMTACPAVLAARSVPLPEPKLRREVSAVSV